MPWEPRGSPGLAKQVQTDLLVGFGVLSFGVLGDSDSIEYNL